jgi:hypothetical protein
MMALHCLETTLEDMNKALKDRAEKCSYDGIAAKNRSRMRQEGIHQLFIVSLYHINT